MLQENLIFCPLKLKETTEIERNINKADAIGFIALCICLYHYNLLYTL